MKKLLLVLFLLTLPSVHTQPANAFVGSCSIQVQPLGYFQPFYANGDTTSFGYARNYCISRGGGVIAIGPGCENLHFTYPTNANLLVIKSFKTGWCADPFSGDCPLPGSSIVNIFTVGGITPASGQCVIWALKGITPNFFFKVFGGTQVGFDSAKVFVATKGLIIRGPGCEQGVNIGTIPDSVSVMALDGGSFNSYAKVTSIRDRAGVQHFKADSTGITVDKLVGDTLATSKVNFKGSSSGGIRIVAPASPQDQLWILPGVIASGYLQNNGTGTLSWGASAVDTANFFWRPGKPTGGQTAFGNLFGYSGINAGLILRGFNDSGTQDSTAQLTLDNVAVGEAQFKVNAVSMIAKTGTKGWSIALNSAGNRGDVTHDGGYLLQPVTTGSGLRINMTNSGTGINPFDIQAKAGSTVDQLTLSNSSGTVQAGFTKNWFVRLGGSTFASLPTPVAGTIAYCSDCNTTDPPTAGGTGAIISYLNGAWHGTGGLANPLIVVDTLRVGGVTDLNSTLTEFRGLTVTAAGTTTLGVGNIFTITGGTNITSITIKPAGTRVVLNCDACNLIDGGNLNLNGNFAGDSTGDPDSITLDSDGTNWVEATRSLN